MFKTEIGSISNSFVQALKPFESSLIKPEKWKLQLLSHPMYGTTTPVMLPCCLRLALAVHECPRVGPPHYSWYE